MLIRAPLSVDKKRFLGGLAIFGSAFCLYLSTLVIRLSQRETAIDPAFFVFARFSAGFIVVCMVMKARGVRLKIVNRHLLIGRTAANCISVFCFYKAVAISTLAEANILNMTYPLFVGLFSWAILKDQRDITATGVLFAAFYGVWLVLAPERMDFNVNNLWGLASGMFGAAAILYLNVSRQYHDTNTILFFLFGIGSLGIFAAFYQRMFLPGPMEAMYLGLCGGSGVLGQYLLTLGFRYVTAVEGSVISSTRILLAAMLGPVLAGDPELSLSGWAGAVLIFGSNVFLAVRKKNRPTG